MTARQRTPKRTDDEPPLADEPLVLYRDGDWYLRDWPLAELRRRAREYAADGGACFHVHGFEQEAFTPQEAAFARAVLDGFFVELQADIEWTT